MHASHHCTITFSHQVQSCRTTSFTLGFFLSETNWGWRDNRDVRQTTSAAVDHGVSSQDFSSCHERGGRHCCSSNSAADVHTHSVLCMRVPLQNEPVRAKRVACHSHVRICAVGGKRQCIHDGESIRPIYNRSAWPQHHIDCSRWAGMLCRQQQLRESPPVAPGRQCPRSSSLLARMASSIRPNYIHFTPKQQHHGHHGGSPYIHRHRSTVRRTLLAGQMSHQLAVDFSHLL